MAEDRHASASAALALFALAQCSIHASALSSPSRLSGYHFSTSSDAVPRKVMASDLRRKSKPYVPSGLTEEQYRRIRAEEAAELRAKDLGMWGPRFKPAGGDPDGNWFNLPSLWTGGFEANGGAATRDGDASREEDGGPIPARSLAAYARRYGFAYLMLLLSIQLHVKRLTSPRRLAVSVLMPLIVLRPLSSFAANVGQRRLVWLNKNGTTKMAGATAVLMAALALVTGRW